MAQHNELGDWGECAARVYLACHHYHLLHANWRNGHLELDIVATKWGETVFVEVKTRSSEHRAPATEALTREKRVNLIAAARLYLREQRLTDFPYRFDLITVVGSPVHYEINHYENAFTETDY